MKIILNSEREQTVKGKCFVLLYFTDCIKQHWLSMTLTRKSLRVCQNYGQCDKIHSWRELMDNRIRTIVILLQLAVTSYQPRAAATHIHCPTLSEFHCTKAIVNVQSTGDEICVFFFVASWFTYIYRSTGTIVCQSTRSTQTS